MTRYRVILRPGGMSGRFVVQRSRLFWWQDISEFPIYVLGIQKARRQALELANMARQLATEVGDAA